MEIILLEEVKSLGKQGETVKVKDGYARNFLIPNKLAMVHSKGAEQVIEEKKKKQIRKLKKEKEGCQETAKKLAQLSINIAMESGVDDALFGTVTTEAVWHALQQEGIQIDKKSIIINEPIKKLGVYTIEVKLHPEVKQEMRIWVVKK